MMKSNVFAVSILHSALSAPFLVTDVDRFSARHVASLGTKGDSMRPVYLSEFAGV
jgi:hypothetical protein